MVTCRTVTRQMLPNAIEVSITGKESLHFERAKQIADQKAREKSPDPMLMAWYEKKSGAFSPRVECCSEEKPGWLVYAESRGGDIIIDINDQDYIFVYREG